MTANNDALPPLPEPFGELERRGVWNGLPRSGFDDVFDADQMRDYARAAIRALSADRGEAVSVAQVRGYSGLTEAEELRDVLLRNGFVECDIAACMCGSWHHRYGIRERMNEITDELRDVGVLDNSTGNLPLRAIQKLRAQRDEAEASLAACRAGIDGLVSDWANLPAGTIDSEYAVSKLKALAVLPLAGESQ